MPLYEYECPAGHVTEHLRKYGDRDIPAVCHCRWAAQRIEISKPHCMPDGMYSYAPNIGDARQFERRKIAIRNGDRVIRKERD